MKIELRHIGGNPVYPSQIIEMNITGQNLIIREDITDMNSRIDPDFIKSLRDIAQELEDQNNLINTLKK